MSQYDFASRLKLRDAFFLLVMKTCEPLLPRMVQVFPHFQHRSDWRECCVLAFVGGSLVPSINQSSPKESGVLRTGCRSLNQHYLH
jgi:hypothetical protein